MEILYVKIGYENGVYVFKNDLVCSEIPEDICVNTPFFNQENSMDELVETILEEPEEKVVFLYNSENQNLVRGLGKRLSAEFGKEIIFIGIGLSQNYIYSNGREKIYLLGCFENLKQMEQLHFIECSEIPGLNIDPEKKYDQQYYLAMKNGYEAFVTGIYPEQMSSTLAKHIGVETAEDARKMSEYLDINGAVFVRDIDDDKKKQFLGDFSAHCHQVQEECVRFDDSHYSCQKCVCTYTQFKELEKESSLKRGTTYYLKIIQPSDFECFKEDLMHFKNTGMINTVGRRLVDECRWTNHCTLKCLTRYSIENNYVKPCLTSSQLLSEVEEEPSMQLISANKLADRTMIIRDCTNCEMSLYCSKCACLPDSFDKNTYCEFLHKLPYVAEYLQKRQVVNFISQNSNVFKNMEEIEVSSSVHCFEYPVQEKRKPANRVVYIFRKYGEYFFMHLIKGTLIKIERKYVFLLEGWALGESEEEVISSMTKKYHMPISDARTLVIEGYERLKKGGMIA